MSHANVFSLLLNIACSGTNTPTQPTLSQATAGPEAEVTTAESPGALLICRLEILNKVLINVKCFMTNIVCDGGC